MDFFEVIVMFASIFFTYKFFSKWYLLTFSIWPPIQHKTTRTVFGWLPFISFAIILFTLKVLASFDVVNNSFYIFFYLILGYLWLYFTLFLMTYYFDISWIDDALSLKNHAALFSITGGFIASTIIYSGANIGDGPGWWCVIVAGGLGIVTWVILGRFINIFTNIFERITIDRDIYSGIRFGFYLIASGIILGRASAGDWTSLDKTIIEFMDGWPVIPLAIIFILIERFYIHIAKVEYNIKHNYLSSSLFWGFLFLAFAIVSILIFMPIEDSYLNLLIFI